MKSQRWVMLLADYLPFAGALTLTITLAIFYGQGETVGVRMMETIGLFGVWPVSGVWFLILMTLATFVIAINELPVTVRIASSLIFAIYAVHLPFGFAGSDYQNRSILAMEYLLMAVSGWGIGWMAIYNISRMKRDLDERKTKYEDQMNLHRTMSLSIINDLRTKLGMEVYASWPSEEADAQ